MKLIITETQYRILTEQYSEDELRVKYVDSELIPENQFNEILNNIKKPFYVGWLLKMLSSGFIKYEDAYKFKNYFNIFEKFKQHYPIKDLGQIKTLQDVDKFERKSKDILIKQQDNEQGDISDKKNLVSTNDIQKLESVGIKYLGMVDGLQSFQVPPEVKDSKEAWNVYREILGKCSGRDKGQIVSICTMAGFDSFKEYLKNSPGSSYYVFYNLGDPKSPYQFHYDSTQFMDKNDDDISESELFINLTKFLLKKGLSEKLIPIYYKEKLGLEITDDEKNTIKGIKYVLTDIVNNITLDDKLEKGRKWFISNIDEYNKKFLIGLENDLIIIFGSLGKIFRPNNINYYPGMGKISNELFINMINKKFPKLNLTLSDFVTMHGEESNYKW
jgi:hypothetical protein